MRKPKLGSYPFLPLKSIAAQIGSFWTEYDIQCHLPWSKLHSLFSMAFTQTSVSIASNLFSPPFPFIAQSQSLDFLSVPWHTKTDRRLSAIVTANGTLPRSHLCYALLTSGSLVSIILSLLVLAHLHLVLVFKLNTNNMSLSLSAFASIFIESKLRRSGIKETNDEVATLSICQLKKQRGSFH